jgi:hypothetical protein
MGMSGLKECEVGVHIKLRKTFCKNLFGLKSNPSKLSINDTAPERD